MAQHRAATLSKAPKDILIDDREASTVLSGASFCRAVVDCKVLDPSRIVCDDRCRPSGEDKESGLMREDCTRKQLL